MIEGMEKIVREHRFFADLDDDTIKLIAGCARNVVFKAGEYLFHTGDAADEFYLIRHGRVALDVVAPGRKAITFQTVGEGEIVGVSWLLPPYQWMHDARAVELVRAIGMDAKLPARQMRRRSRRRLRDDDALRAAAGQPAAGDPHAASGCLWRLNPKR